MTNIIHSFGLGFNTIWWLGHLCYRNDIYKHFVCECVHNEVAWMGDLAQLPLEGNFILQLEFAQLLASIVLFHPFCVQSYKC
jgi:hypothetical protein